MTQDIEYHYDKGKSAALKKDRGFGFEEILQFMDDGCPTYIINHPNQKKYPGQFMYEVEVDNYMIVVPFVQKGNVITLKTLYPSRKVTKKYRNQKNEKESHKKQS